MWSTLTRCILRFTVTVISNSKLRLQKVIIVFRKKPQHSVNDKSYQTIGLGLLNYQLLGIH